MLYISSFKEVADAIELNLLRSIPFVSDSHLAKLTLHTNTKIKRLGKCIGSIGNHHLIMDPDTASWALMDSQEAKVYRLVEDCEFGELSEEFQDLPENDLILFLKALYRRGLVCIDDKYPIRLDIYDDEPPYHDTLLIELLVSERCNMGCLYCQANSSAEKKDMLEEVAEATIKRSFELPYQMIIFEISGGEPLINFGLVSRIVESIEINASATGRIVIINVVSNGTLITPDVAKFIRDHNIKLTLSLDGPEGIHELSRPLAGEKPSWGMQQRGLDILTKNEVPFSVVLTVNSRNHIYADEIVHFLGGLAARSVKMNPVLRIGRAANQNAITISNKDYLVFMKAMMNSIMNGNTVVREFIISEMVNRLITRFRDYRCMRTNCNAGITYFVIDPKGRVFPCAAMTEFPHTELGNISKLDGRLDKWLSRSSFVQRFNSRRIWRSEVCCDCEWRNFCQGGCIVETLRDPEVDFKSVRDPNCDFFRGMYRHIMETLSLTPGVLGKYLQSESFGYGPGWVKDERFF